MVGDIGVVLPGHALPNGRLHEPGQRRQYVDRGEHLSVVELTVHVDLTLRDVPRQIGDGMGDVCGEKQSGLVPSDRVRAARFHTLNFKNAHNSKAKCANFASIISILIIISELRI